jgi:hypothetical protein
MLAAAISLASLLGACGVADSSTPPPVPAMVPYNDDPFAKIGIRADPDAPDPGDPNSGAIIVEWHRIDPATLVNIRIGGYYLYRSDTRDAKGTPINFTRITRIAVSIAADDSVYQDTDVKQETVYSYYVTSFNRSDESQESKPSDTVSFILSKRPVPTYPITDSIPLPPSSPLSFQFGPPLAGGIIAIEVNRVQPENELVLINNVWSASNINAGFESPEVFFDPGRATLETGARYRWRVVKYFPLYPGQIPYGNSSRWVTFTLKD